MKEDASHHTFMSSILFFGIKQTFLQRQKSVKLVEKIRIECRGDLFEILDLVFVMCVRESRCPLYRR